MEFQFKDHTYRADKLSAIDQFHITRRLAPLLPGVFGLSGISGLQDLTSEKIAPFAEAISRMSDAEANYVLFGLLKAISRKEPKGLGWSKVCTGEALMFQDITMDVMIHLAVRSLQNSLGDFFKDALSALTDEGQKQNDQ